MSRSGRAAAAQKGLTASGVARMKQLGENLCEPRSHGLKAQFGRVVHRVSMYAEYLFSLSLTVQQLSRFNSSVPHEGTARGRFDGQ